MQTTEIVEALRCMSTEGNVAPDCKGCPFYAREQLDPETAEKLGIIGEGEWYSCDCNAVGFAAADLIENQQNHIRALLQANEALRERQRWIPVTERLPEIAGLVLVIASGKLRENVELIDALELGEYADDGWCLESYPEWMDANVAHWMPLPPAPEVE